MMVTEESLNSVGCDGGAIRWSWDFSKAYDVLRLECTYRGALQHCR